MTLSDDHLVQENAEMKVKLRQADERYQGVCHENQYLSHDNKQLRARIHELESRQTAIPVSRIPREG